MVRIFSVCLFSDHWDFNDIQPQVVLEIAGIVDANILGVIEPRSLVDKIHVVFDSVFAQPNLAAFFFFKSVFPFRLKIIILNLF